MYNRFLNFKSKEETIRNVKVDYAKFQKPFHITLEKLQPFENICIVGRFAPLETISCQWALSKVYLQMTHFIIPKRAEHLRTLANELQNLCWLFDYLKNVSLAMGDQIYNQYFYHLREICFDTQDMWTGSRVMPHYLNLSGVSRDLSIGVSNKMKNIFKYIENEYMQVQSLILSDKVYLSRLKGVLVIDQNLAKHFRWGGIVGLGSGVNIDTRLNKQMGTYTKSHILETQLDIQNGDAHSRFMCALYAVRKTITNLNSLLSNVPEGDYTLNQNDIYQPPEAFYFDEVMSISGPIYAYYLDGKVFLSSSSTRISSYLPKLLNNIDVLDIPIAIASVGFDPEQGALN